MVFSHGAFTLVVPKKVIYNNKQIDTLTKTNLPSRRKGEQSIHLKSSSKVEIPKVQVTINDKLKYSPKLVHAIEDQIKSDQQIVNKIEQIQQKQQESKNAIKSWDDLEKLIFKNYVSPMDKSSSNKYKSGHSTYGSIHRGKYLINWLKSNYDTLDNYKFIDTNMSEEAEAELLSSYRRIAKNIYYVGHNAGHNAGGLSVGSFVTFFKKYKDKALSILNSRLNKQLKMEEEQEMERHRRDKAIDEEHRDKMKTDPTYRAQVMKRQKQLQDQEAYFMHMEGKSHLKELERRRKLEARQKHVETHQTENRVDNDILYLSGWLEITQPTDPKKGKLYKLIYDEMFDIMDKHIYKKTIYDKIDDIDIGNIHDYLDTWLSKKENNDKSAYIDDFIALVIYPYLKKLNPKFNQFILRLYSIDIAVEYQTVFKRAIEPIINKKAVVHSLINQKHGSIKPELFKLDNELHNLWEDLINVTHGTGDKFQNPNYKPKSQILNKSQ